MRCALVYFQVSVSFSAETTQDVYHIGTMRPYSSEPVSSNG